MHTDYLPSHGFFYLSTPHLPPSLLYKSFPHSPVYLLCFVTDWGLSVWPWIKSCTLDPNGLHRRHTVEDNDFPFLGVNSQQFSSQEQDPMSSFPYPWLVVDQSCPGPQLLWVYDWNACVVLDGGTSQLLSPFSSSHIPSTHFSQCSLNLRLSCLAIVSIFTTIH